MWPRLTLLAALAANALALALNAGWMTSIMDRHHAAGWTLGDLAVLGVAGLLLLSGPAAAFSVLARNAPPLAPRKPRLAAARGPA